MQTITLIRHAHPDFPLSERLCLGRTDLPLGAFGRMQAALLAVKTKYLPLGTIFSSPLLRCLETAAFLLSKDSSAGSANNRFATENNLDVHATDDGAIRVIPDLQEQDMGPWDGLDFEDIQKKWPDLYKKRSSNRLLLPDGAETLSSVQKRAVHAVLQALKETEGNVTFVTHASVIQALCAYFKGTPLSESFSLRLPYTGCVQIVVPEVGTNMLGQNEESFYFSLAAPACLCRQLSLPVPPLTPVLAKQLLYVANPGEKICRHCQKVAQKAQEIAQTLPLPLDQELLYSSALLHDVARGENKPTLTHDMARPEDQPGLAVAQAVSGFIRNHPDAAVTIKKHAETGAAWLGELGYEKAADLIRQHHDLMTDNIDEAAVLYLADKYIQEDQEVSLEERFAASEKKCVSEEAKAAHAARRQKAFDVQNRINNLTF